MDSKKAIGNRINSALALRKMKQKELANSLGVTANTISYFCSGSRSPNLAQIIQISKTLNVTTDYLLGLSNDPSPTPSAVDELGLPEKAISYFAGLQHSQNAELAETVYRIMENDELPALLFQINIYIAAIKAESIFKAIEEKERNKYLLEKDTDILSEKVDNQLSQAQSEKLFDFEDELEKRIIHKTIEIAKSGKYGEMVSNSLKAHCQQYGYHSSDKEFRLFSTGVHGTSLVDLSKYNVSESLSKLLEKIKTETKAEVLQ